MSQGFQEPNSIGDANPYSSMAPLVDTGDPSNAPPMLAVPMTTTTRVVSTLFIVFGALGTMGLVATLIVFPMLLIASFAGIDPASEMGKGIQQIRDAMPIGMMLISLFGGIASVFMLVGGIAAIQGKRWGANVIRKTAAFYAFYKVVEGIGSTISQYYSMQTNIRRIMEEAKTPPNFDIESMMMIIFYVTAAFVGLFSVAMMAFYSWVYLYFRKPSTLEQFR